MQPKHCTGSVHQQDLRDGWIYGYFMENHFLSQPFDYFHIWPLIHLLVIGKQITRLKVVSHRSLYPGTKTAKLSESAD